MVFRFVNLISDSIGPYLWALGGSSCLNSVVIFSVECIWWEDIDILGVPLEGSSSGRNGEYLKYGGSAEKMKLKHIIWLFLGYNLAGLALRNPLLIFLYI